MLQFSILKNIVQYLKPSKQLVYITCSVYGKENELVVDKAMKYLNLKLISQNYIEGYQHNADTMF